MLRKACSADTAAHLDDWGPTHPDCSRLSRPQSEFMSEDFQTGIHRAIGSPQGGADQDVRFLSSGQPKQSLVVLGCPLAF